ncbi:hypothetical protein GACE_0496 [Geoglobus acetivorans]|uniref:Uncharacterized protein n=1 Tax=Geoglobus acetivorans TaxID=565033 RepID=A0A0A7GBW9_GEOAI|nr:hypothetical protein GACE_0496 [Geoglobus acetivorans]
MKDSEVLDGIEKSLELLKSLRDLEPRYISSDCERAKNGLGKGEKVNTF